MATKKLAKSNTAVTSSEIHQVWRDALRQQSCGVPEFWHSVFVVMEERCAGVPCVQRLSAAVLSGVRRRFVLISHADIVEWVRGDQRPDGSGARKPAPAKTRPAAAAEATHAENALLASASQQLATDGQLDLETTALLIKQCVQRHVVERHVAATTASSPTKRGSTGANSSEISGAALLQEPAAGLQKEARKTKKSRSILNHGRHPTTGSSTGVADEWTVAATALCDKSSVSLRRRGEPDEPQYTCDEPVDGPDLYVLLVGFYAADLLTALAVCQVSVECVLRVACDQCLPPVATAATDSDEKEDCDGAAYTPKTNVGGDECLATTFWRRLQHVLEESTWLLRHVVVTHVPVDTCRLLLAADDSQANQYVFDTLVPHVYSWIMQRRLYDVYIESVRVIDVPRVSSRSNAITRQSRVSVKTAALVDHSVDGGGALTKLSLVVAWLLDVLVESVCEATDGGASTAPAMTGDEASVMKQTTDDDEPQSYVDFASVNDDHRASADLAPTIVYDGDSVSSLFWRANERRLALTLEHVTTQTCELAALHGITPSSPHVRARYTALLHELCACGAVSSVEHAAVVVTTLLFDAVWPEAAAGGVNRPLPIAFYPHAFRPPILAVHQSAAECESMQSRPAVRYCAVERLDSSTLAQQLLETRVAGASLVAGYYFAGDDCLLLMYDSDDRHAAWQWRGHTTLGMRDFMTYVRDWHAVSDWLCEKQRQLEQAAVAAAAQAATMAATTVSVSRRGSSVVPSEHVSVSESSHDSHDSETTMIPDDYFILPGSLKDQARATAAAHEQQHSTATRSDKKTSDNKREHSKQQSGAENAAPSSPPSPQQQQQHTSPADTTDPQPSAVSGSSGECWRRSLAAVVCGDGDQGQLPFFGYDLPERLLRVSGACQRRRFSDGSLLVVEHIEYERRTPYMRVCITAGQCQVSLHPAGEISRDRVVAYMHDDCVVQTDVVVCWSPASVTGTVINSLAATTTTAAAATAAGTDNSNQSASVVADHAAAVVTAERTKKKTRQSPAGGGGRRKAARQASTVDVATQPPEVQTAETPQPPAESQQPASRVRSEFRVLRVCCAHGLVVELLPAPLCSSAGDDNTAICGGAAPCVRVRQYYVRDDCRRTGVRLVMSDGSLVCLPDDQVRQFDGQSSCVRLLNWDGRYLDARWCDVERALLPTRSVSASGLEIIGDDRQRQHRVKMMTDPVSGQLYVERDDGLRAMQLDERRFVKEHGDGTRFTVTFSEQEMQQKEQEEKTEEDVERLPNDSDMSDARVSRLLDMCCGRGRVAVAPSLVCVEHERYARVLLNQTSGECEVHLPGASSLVVRSSATISSDGGGGGSFRVTAAVDGTTLQVDERCVCFTAATTAADKTVTHILRRNDWLDTPASTMADTDATDGVARATDAAHVADSPPVGVSAGRRASDSATECYDGLPPAGCGLGCADVLCESVDLANGSVWRVMSDARIISSAAPSTESGSSVAISPSLSLFVLHRDGSGRRLLTEPDVQTYCDAVKRDAPGTSHVSSTPVDGLLRVVRCFQRPRRLQLSARQRWRMSLQSDSDGPLWPPAGLRCCSMRSLARCGDDATPMAVSARAIDVIWQRDNDMTDDCNSATTELCATGDGVVLFRELLVTPTLDTGRWQRVLATGQAANSSNRLSEDSVAATTTTANSCVWTDVSSQQASRHSRLWTVYGDDRLLAVWRDACSPAVNHAGQVDKTSTPARARATSNEQTRRHAAEHEQRVLMYRRMLTEHRFRPYFATPDGSEFLTHVRVRRPPMQRCPRDETVVAPSQQPAIEWAAGSDSVVTGTWSSLVSVQPQHIDLGLVLPYGEACAHVELSSLASVALHWSVVPLRSDCGWSVRPGAGVLAPRGGSVRLRVRLTAAEAVLRAGCRVLFWPLHLRVGQRLDDRTTLHVTVAACIASADMAEVLARAETCAGQCVRA